jgi:hypothetical protein
VNELDFYNLGRDQLAEAIGISGMKTTALIWHLRLQDDSDCFKEIKIGTSRFKRYSQKAIPALKAALADGHLDKAWQRYCYEYLGWSARKAR